MRIKKHVYGVYTYKGTVVNTFNNLKLVSFYHASKGQLIDFQKFKNMCIYRSNTINSKLPAVKFASKKVEIEWTYHFKHQIIIRFEVNFKLSGTMN